MSDLTEFLLARIAEDEEAAKRAERWFLVDFNNAENDEHGTRHKPARVLVECDVKRQIVAFADQCHRDEERFGPGDAVMTSRYGAALVALRFLALPYAAHPDYDPAWSA